MNKFDALVDHLADLAPETPDEVPVIALDHQRDPMDRATEVARRWGEAMGIDLTNAKPERRRSTTLLRGDSGGRATIFHASSALSLRAGIEPFAELFEEDPGDAALSETVDTWATRLRVSDLVSGEDRLDLERLWRIKAAGVDPKDQSSETFLCRAVGALRHHVHDLPVLGRASAHVEVTGHGNLSAASLTLRRFADSRDGVLTAVRPRDVHDAAREVAARVARMVGGDQGAELDGELVPEMFAYGYLSLGRRRAQSLLAPMYVAAVSIAGRPGQTRSAHLIPVAGSQERFLKLPSGSGAAATPRVA